MIEVTLKSLHNALFTLLRCCRNLPVLHLHSCTMLPTRIESRCFCCHTPLHCQRCLIIIALQVATLFTVKRWGQNPSRLSKDYLPTQSRADFLNPTGLPVSTSASTLLYNDRPFGFTHVEERAPDFAVLDSDSS